MLHVLTHQILPVFSMLALGFLLGLLGRISRQEAASVNRVAFLVMQPALIFPMVNELDWSAFRFDAIALYGGSQVVFFTLTFMVARHLLRRDVVEAWLLSMACVFVNSLLYIWPISFLIYGEAAALPVTAVVAWDTVVSFSFFIVTTDILVNRGTARIRTVKRLATNPVLIAIALGAIGNALALSTPAPLLTAMDFAGVGAAPLTLFALGVILSGQKLRPTPTVVAITSLKLIGFPLLVWLALHLGQRPGNWDVLLVLCAAGPSGAMAFALAMLHGIRTDAIAPVVIWTSVLSLFSLAWLA